MDMSLLRKISNSKILLDILIEMEDFLDKNDLYVYDNWFSGEILEGPIVERYWITVILKYSFKDKPDVAGFKRLEKYDVKCSLVQGKEKIYNRSITEPDLINLTNATTNPLKPPLSKTDKPTEYPYWEMTLKMPRRYFDSILSIDNLEINDSDDVDTVTSTQNLDYLDNQDSNNI